MVKLQGVTCEVGGKGRGGTPPLRIVVCRVCQPIIKTLVTGYEARHSMNSNAHRQIISAISVD